MVKELVLILSDGIREYFKESEVLRLCALFGIELNYNDSLYHQEPDYIYLAQQLITEIEHGNNRRFFESLVPSLFTRCSELAAKTSFESREHHEEMQNRLEQLRPLLDSRGIPTEISVPDNHPFTAKSRIRELVNSADTDVFLVDRYIGPGTLDCLREIVHLIRILTGTRERSSIESGFDAAVNDFRKEGHEIEIRLHPQLHGRYLIFNSRCWLIGGSIKDAGKKALNVIECVDIKSAIVSEVEKKWDEATVYS